jgi:hypothetical protein
MLAGRYNPTQTLLPYVPGYDKYFWDKSSSIPGQLEKPGERGYDK